MSETTKQPTANDAAIILYQIAAKADELEGMPVDYGLGLELARVVKRIRESVDRPVEQPSPQPEKCPTCGSDKRSLKLCILRHIMFCNTQEHQCKLCSDPWHDVVETPRPHPAVQMEAYAFTGDDVPPSGASQISCQCKCHKKESRNCPSCEGNGHCFDCHNAHVFGHTCAACGHPRLPNDPHPCCAGDREPESQQEASPSAREFSINDAAIWLKKLEALDSFSAKLIHLRHFGERYASDLQARLAQATLHTKQHADREERLIQRLQAAESRTERLQGQLTEAEAMREEWRGPTESQPG